MLCRTLSLGCAEWSYAIEFLNSSSFEKGSGFNTRDSKHVDYRPYYVDNLNFK